MGTVYRARDTKLNRDVALKVLSDSFVDDPARLARLRREAQVLASVDHAHVAGIHGIEDDGQTTALVLEFADGATLAERIGDGPLPVDEGARAQPIAALSTFPPFQAFPSFQAFQPLRALYGHQRSGWYTVT